MKAIHSFFLLHNSMLLKGRTLFTVSCLTSETIGSPRTSPNKLTLIPKTTNRATLLLRDKREKKRAFYNNKYSQRYFHYLSKISLKSVTEKAPTPLAYYKSSKLG